MFRRIVLAWLLAGFALPAWSQTTGSGYEMLSPSLASSAKAMHATIRRDLAESAEAMPADEYSFQPTPEVRTFGQLLGHVINANYFFCAEAKGEKPPTRTNYEKVADKAALVKALHDALAYCDESYQATTDANFGQAVKIDALAGVPGADTVRGAVLMFNVAHNNEHYGNLVVYMRLKGHVPPSSARAAQPKK